MMRRKLSSARERGIDGLGSDRARRECVASEQHAARRFLDGADRSVRRDFTDHETDRAGAHVHNRHQFGRRRLVRILGHTRLRGSKGDAPRQSQRSRSMLLFGEDSPVHCPTIFSSLLCRSRTAPITSRIVTSRAPCRQRWRGLARATRRHRTGSGDCNQLPISPPSSFVITRHAERGRPPSSPSGHELNAFGLAGSFRTSLELGRSGVSPGCWMPTNIVRSSGVTVTPVISHCLGPTRNRRISPVVGFAHNIWLLPNPA